jgi:tetratricopeptide (TPR) repeat protein
MRSRTVPSIAGLLLLLCGCINLGVPQWSIDGRRIVYTRLEGMKTPAVWFVDLDGQVSPSRIVSSGLQPRWSPDGERVYFLALLGGSEGAQRTVLRSCRSDGSDVLDHAPGSTGEISWYGLDSSGSTIYYLRGDSSELYSLNTETARATKVLAEGTRCKAAAMGDYGRLLAVAVESKGAGGRQVLEFLTLEPGVNEPPRKLAATVALSDSDSARQLTLLVRPGGRELVAAYDPGERVHVLPLFLGRPRQLKTSIPGDILFASCSPDGFFLDVTTVMEEDGVRFASQRLHLDTGDSVVIQKDSREIVGGRGWGAGGGAYAELCPLGLCVAATDGRWEKYYPAEPREFRRVAEAHLKAGEPAEAIAVLRRVFEDAKPGEDVQGLYFLESDAYLTMGRRREAAESLLRGWLFSPVSDQSPDEFGRRLARLKEEDRLLKAIDGAMKETPPKRAKALIKAMSMVADSRLIAGIAFRTAEAYFEGQDYMSASRYFRLAGETADFAFADYATGLAALSQFVLGRNDPYAVELLMKSIDQFPTSPLQDDFRAALLKVRDPAGAVLRRTSEAGTPAGNAAWVSVKSARIVEWSASPSLSDEDGTKRRLVVRTNLRSSLVIARSGERGEAVFADLPVELGQLAFSPDGRHLAFLAKGVVPGHAEAVWADAFVVDMQGNVLVGDAGTLFAGMLVGADAMQSVSWSDGGKSLVVQLLRADGSLGELKSIDVVQPRRDMGGLPSVRRR